MTRRGFAARAVALAAAAVTVASVAPAAGSTAAAAPSACRARTLVLSAMPVELSPLLGQADHVKVLRDGTHTFFVGRLRGSDVVLALTGIGPVNARRTTKAALARFRCGGRPGITAVVFSGVAGGDFIGDVIVPRAWTADAGRHVVRADPHLLGVARRLARRHLGLERRDPTGDPLCTCAPVSMPTVEVQHTPRLEVGGTGQTTDPFSGHALPCVPGGGDVFGCDPCPADKHLADEAAESLPGFTAVADPSFFAGYLSTSESSRYVVEDEETGAVAAVAHRHHVPMLGIRAVSDGGGDPLHLPGFPAEFFVYRQLAADNAARTTLAVLHAIRSH